MRHSETAYKNVEELAQLLDESIGVKSDEDLSQIASMAHMKVWDNNPSPEWVQGTLIPIMTKAKDHYEQAGEEDYKERMAARITVLNGYVNGEGSSPHIPEPHASRLKELRKRVA
ncbi:hypothetical protein HOA55_02010 [archaeon]|jgi:hypothetical protein|nr:hypothetical protein [archaeon]MBT7025387.1 hypothetical protein [archaeon]MBT7568158.1 hypothetical protein [archaeon]MBT7705974.1 hypothetical protein [archaeon]